MGSKGCTWAVLAAIVVGTCLLAGGSLASTHLSATGGLPAGDMIKPSGSYNTKIFVQSVNNQTRAQGDPLEVFGYVTVANLSSGQYDPWPNVSIALIMNNSFIWRTYSPASIVNTTTNARGNFTLVYTVTSNQTLGYWTVTAGLSPIVNYNYTYDPFFSGTKNFTVTIVAYTIFHVTGFSPAEFNTHQPFTITGNILTLARNPVGNQTVIVVFSAHSPLLNYTTETVPDGSFSFDISALDANDTFDLIYAGGGFFLPTSLLNQAVPFMQANVYLSPSVFYAVFPGEPYTIDGNITSPIGGIDLAVQLSYANGSTQLYTPSMQPAGYGLMQTTAAGTFHFMIRDSSIPPSLTNMTVIANYDGLGAFPIVSYGPFPVRFISSVKFENVSVDGKPIASQGIRLDTDTVVSGTILSNYGTPVAGHSIEFLDVGTGENFNGSTDASGAFSITFQVTRGTANSKATFEFLIVPATGPTLNSSTYLITILPQNNAVYYLWLIPVAVAAVVFGVYGYNIFLKKREVQQTRSYIQKKMDVVRSLVLAGKYREGIAYCYQSLVEIATKQYDLEEPQVGQTAREFIEFLVTEKNVPPEHAFQFMSSVQESLYSHHEITKDHVSSTLAGLGSLYCDITSDVADCFTIE
jgi:hypothetical protein